MTFNPFELPPPFKANALFRGGQPVQMNACVGDNGGPYDFYAYALGFFEAARLIIESARNPRSAVDTLVYPACFNFRHGIELFIKHAINAVEEIDGSGPGFKMNHKLSENWKALKQRLTNIGLQIDQQHVDQVELIIACFEEVDPNGQIFRYPESIKGIQHLKEWSLINLDVVGRALARITDIFRQWTFEIDGALEYVREYRAASW